MDASVWPISLPYTLFHNRTMCCCIWQSHIQHGSASPCLLVYDCQAKHEFVKALFPTSWPRCRHRCTSTLATLLWSPTTPSPPPRCWSSPPSSGPTSTPTPSTLLSLRIMILTLRYSYNHRVFSKYCPIIRFKEILKTLKISWSTNDSWITVYELKFTVSCGHINAHWCLLETTEKTIKICFIDRAIFCKHTLCIHSHMNSSN